MDPETGKCVWTDEQLATPVKKLQKCITVAQQGTFIPDRENNVLTEALGNPEHPGRTRGKLGSIAWKVGFLGAGGYKTRERRRKLEQCELQKLNARVRKLEEQVESQRGAEATPKATPPSQRRSGVASAELVQQPDFTAPIFPVDAITEAQHCQLMTQ